MPQAKRAQAVGLLLALAGVALLALLEVAGIFWPPAPASQTRFIGSANVTWELIGKEWLRRDGRAVLRLELEHARGAGRPGRDGLALGRDMCRLLLRKGGPELRATGDWAMELRFHFQDRTRSRWVRVDLREEQCGAAWLLEDEPALAAAPNLFAIRWELNGTDWSAHVDLVPGERQGDGPPPAAQSLAICQALVGRLPSPFAPLVKRRFVRQVLVGYRRSDATSGPRRRVEIRNGVCRPPETAPPPPAPPPPAPPRVKDPLLRSEATASDGSIREYRVGDIAWPVADAEWRAGPNSGYFLRLSFRATRPQGSGENPQTLDRATLTALCRAVLAQPPPGKPALRADAPITRLGLRLQLPPEPGQVAGEFWGAWREFPIRGGRCQFRPRPDPLPAPLELIGRYEAARISWALGQADWRPAGAGYVLRLTFIGAREAVSGLPVLRPRPDQLQALCAAVLRDLPPGGPEGVGRPDVHRLALRLTRAESLARASGSWRFFDLRGRDCSGAAVQAARR